MLLMLLAQANSRVFFSPCRRPVGWDGPPTSYWRGSPAFAILAGGEREAAGARWQLPARVSQQVGEVRRSARERVSCGRQFQEAGRQGPLHRDRHDGCPAGGPARTRRRSNPRRGFCRALAGERTDQLACVGPPPPADFNCDDDESASARGS